MNYVHFPKCRNATTLTTFLVIKSTNEYLKTCCIYAFNWISYCEKSPSGGSTVPREGFDSSVIMPFSGVLWLWQFLYNVAPHPMSSLRLYTSVVSLAFMAGAASQAGDADFSQGTWFHLWSAGVRECPPWCSIVGATVTVHQFFCILHLRR